MATEHRPHPFKDLSVLNQFATKPFPPGLPPDRRVFYAPVDDIKGVLLFLLRQVTDSLVVAMYGFDDSDLAKQIKTLLLAPDIYVQLTLDSSQAAGVHEKALLAQEHYPKSSVGVGRSEKGGIMHLKEMVIDSTILVTGSTNWSNSGESLQDNQLTVEINPVFAALAVTRIGGIHASMLSRQRQSSVFVDDGSLPG